MRDWNRRLQILAVLAFLAVVFALIAFAPSATAQHYTIVPADQCNSCPPGPWQNGNQTCTPIGCARPGSVCIIDCK